jgi:Restriction Enzyme Adenine Methylase Associated
VPQIAVDDQVFAELQRRAVVYVDKEPNDTLRRVLGLEGPAAGPAQRPPSPAVPRRPVRREQKVQLSALVAAGLLKRGERLVCVDYSGQPIASGGAEVGTGNKLVRNGRRYSMSALAIELLRQAGHAVEVARGPAHWRTAEGKTVLELWRSWRSSS